MKKRWPLLLGLWILVGGASGAAGLPDGIYERKPKPAPALRLADVNGKMSDLADLRGRWVFVHFWASWCGPCRRELPAIEAMATALAGAGPAVLMINTAEHEEDVFAFLGGVAPKLVTLLDPDGAASERWQPRGLPATFLVDPEGMIRYVAPGGRAWDTPPYLEFLRGLKGER
jgi:thiol-disulfide isomerase/thioredoxin